MDWSSRHELSGGLSVSLDSFFCKMMWQWALKTANPDIINMDQASQFASEAFASPLLDLQIQISMDGCGRTLENLFVKRLWRTVKYEEVYLKDYTCVNEAFEDLRAYFRYNCQRGHKSLGNQTPEEISAKRFRLTLPENLLR
jgi:putative transposase